MSKDYWKEVLNTTRERLDKLRVRRDKLEAARDVVNLEIVQLEQVMASLTPLASDAPQSSFLVALPRTDMPASLADACRAVLSDANQYVTPIEIRDVLAASGYNLEQHANPLASIHGVLKRMADSGEAETLTHDTKGTLYHLKSTGVQYVRQSAGTRVPGSVAHTPTREGAEVAREGFDVERARRRRAEREAKKEEGASEEVPGLGDSLRKAAGLRPALPKKSALQEMTEKAAKKDEGESSRERLIRNLTKEE